MESSTTHTESSGLEKGIFTISLDFELNWGVRDRLAMGDYAKYVRGIPTTVYEMLSVFSDYGIHATWASVGFLFFTDQRELRRSFPRVTPEYSRPSLSPYDYISESVSLSEPFHFTPDLISLIQQYKGQEIGTHTFSHYYCLEEGQTSDAFREDMSAAVKVAKGRGIQLRSLVFPRNQCNGDYLPIVNEFGIQCYRGNLNTWFHAAGCAEESRGLIRKVFRLLDSITNLTGHHTYSLEELAGSKPFNLRASRYLRPYVKKLAFFDDWRLRRITQAMDDAALNKRVFHMWWHPHEFALNSYENIRFLKKILRHYLKLKQEYGMLSLNMGELAQQLEESIAVKQTKVRRAV